jgi:parallel beta-helix repeat protein
MMRLRCVPARSCLLLLLVAGGRPMMARAEEPTRLEALHDDLEITADAKLVPGVYVVPDAQGDGALVIRTDGVTLDLGGAVLRGAVEDVPPDGFRGTGILVENARDVTIRNGSVRGFKVGVRAVGAPGLRVHAIDASGNYRQRLKSTPEREDPSDWLWPHHNDEGEWETRYGAGLSLTDCRDAEISGCTVNGGQNGLLLTRCESCAVFDNDFSFNSGWGIAFYRAKRCEISHNRCDFCVRGFSQGVYFRGQDSAGILVFEQCSSNVFVRNSATHSGDGFFLYAGHETTERTGTGGSNANLVMENDFSHAVANGIEATFSDGNVFVRNDCSDADHGVWAGYSRHTLILENRMEGCLSAGISIEHGHDNEIGRNRIRGGRRGIHLWWDEDPAFLNGPFGEAQETNSTRNTVYANEIWEAGAAIRLDGDIDSAILGNTLRDCDAFLELAGNAAPGSVEFNRCVGPAEGEAIRIPVVVVNRTGRSFLLSETNTLDGRLTRSEGDPVESSALAPAAMSTVHPTPALPEVRGRMDTAWPEGLPRGRDQMRIDEWGPVHPLETRLFPAHLAAAGREATFHLLGTGPFRVVTASEGVTVSPREGTAPAALTVTAATAAGASVRTFAIEVEVGRPLLPLDRSGGPLAPPCSVRRPASGRTPPPRDPRSARLRVAVRRTGGRAVRCLRDARDGGGERVRRAVPGSECVRRRHPRLRGRDGGDRALGPPRTDGGRGRTRSQRGVAHLEGRALRDRRLGAPRRAARAPVGTAGYFGAVITRLRVMAPRRTVRK